MKTKIERTDEGTTIEQKLEGSEVTMNCFIGTGGGDNSDAIFSLEIPEGGQVLQGGLIKMCGPIERQSLYKFLKLVVEEMEEVSMNSMF